jgi:hypothetical protein
MVHPNNKLMTWPLSPVSSHATRRGPRSRIGGFGSWSTPLRRLTSSFLLLAAAMAKAVEPSEAIGEIINSPFPEAEGTVHWVVLEEALLTSRRPPLDSIGDDNRMLIISSATSNALKKADSRWKGKTILLGDERRSECSVKVEHLSVLSPFIPDVDTVARWRQIDGILGGFAGYSDSELAAISYGRVLEGWKRARTAFWVGKVKYDDLQCPYPLYAASLRSGPAAADPLAAPELAAPSAEVEAPRMAIHEDEASPVLEMIPYTDSRIFELLLRDKLVHALRTCPRTPHQSSKVRLAISAALAPRGGLSFFSASGVSSQCVRKMAESWKFPPTVDGRPLKLQHVYRLRLRR